MKTTYTIRMGSMTGDLIGTVEADTYEDAALLGANLKGAAKTSARGRFGCNRETGTPGMSGVWSVRHGGAMVGQIHVQGPVRS